MDKCEFSVICNAMEIGIWYKGNLPLLGLVSSSVKLCCDLGAAHALPLHGQEELCAALGMGELPCDVTKPKV